MPKEPRETIGLPFRPFLFTLDQIATMLEIDLNTLRRVHIHYEGRSIGAKPDYQMMARNIAPASEKPDWRVTEQEVIRWFKLKGFRIITKTYLRG